MKNNFPIFKNNSDLIYLDNAATTQKPQVLLDSISEYYSTHNSNIGRSVYNLAQYSEEDYNYGVNTIKKFLLGQSSEFKKSAISFSDGCTSSINESAQYVEQIYKLHNKIGKDTIILSVFEHHANIMPWQNLAKKMGWKIHWISSAKELLNPTMIDQKILEKTVVVAICHVSNVTGEVNDLKAWSKVCRDNDILLSVDGAQGVCNFKNPIENLDVDFYSFSAHKYYGPMGLGILYINSRLVEKIQPSKLGGGIIEDVTQEGFYLLEGNLKFNAGTPNIANVYAFAKVINWLDEQKIHEKHIELTQLAFVLEEKLKKIKDIQIINILNQSSDIRAPIVSFNIKGIHAHDVGSYLSQKNIAVRVGKHCTHPLHESLGINSSIRASLGIYNNNYEIHTLLKEVENAINYFKG